MPALWPDMPPSAAIVGDAPLATSGSMDKLVGSCQTSVCGVSLAGNDAGAFRSLRHRVSWPAGEGTASGPACPAAEIGGCECEWGWVWAPSEPAGVVP